MRTSILILASSSLAITASADAPSEHRLEIAADAQFPTFFVDVGEPDEGDDELDLFGAGGSLQVRYFGQHGHGLVSALRFRRLEEFCIFCDDERSALMPSLVAGWGYRAAFAVREHRPVWFDVTPHAAVEIGYLGGDFDVTALGAQLGVDVNLHTRRGVIIGLGGQYEILGVTDGRAMHGPTFVLRIGGAIRT